MGKIVKSEEQVYALSRLKWREQGTSLRKCFQTFEPQYAREAPYYGAVLLVLYCSGQLLLTCFWLGFIVSIAFRDAATFKSHVKWSPYADKVTNWPLLKKWAAEPAQEQEFKEIPNLVGIEKVIARYGEWPSFHDAEVLSLNLDRGETRDFRIPTLDFVIHCWEGTENVLPSGHIECINHSLVSFRFVDVSLVQLKGFNLQNVISTLSVREIDEQGLEVTIHGIHGLDGSFCAASGEVLSVEAFEPNSEPKV